MLTAAGADRYSMFRKVVFSCELFTGRAAAVLAMSAEILSPACVPIRACAEPKNAQHAACRQLPAAGILLRDCLACLTSCRRCGSRCIADVLWTLRRFSPHIRRSLQGKTGARRREK